MLATTFACLGGSRLAEGDGELYNNRDSKSHQLAFHLPSFHWQSWSVIVAFPLEKWDKRKGPTRLFLDCEPFAEPLA